MSAELGHMRTRFVKVIRHFWDHELCRSYRATPSAIISSAVALGIICTALFANWIAPYNPFNLGALSLIDSELPPAWLKGGELAYFLGTDTQGRDVLSLLIYGCRISLYVGFTSVVFSLILGVSLGLLSGYAGKWIDALVMRIADVMLSFPAILIALLISGIARGFVPSEMRDQMAIPILIFSIGISRWVQYARTVRGLVMVQKGREYVQAAQLLGRRPLAIAWLHVLPHTWGPVTVIATINFAVAIVLEATLSFLGVGVPPTEPSLGTLIRVGINYMFSGLWWITIFPSLTLVLLVLSVNLLGDWLRDALDPKLR